MIVFPVPRRSVQFNGRILVYCTPSAGEDSFDLLLRNWAKIGEILYFFVCKQPSRELGKTLWIHERRGRDEKSCWKEAQERVSITYSPEVKSRE